jgi:hypothetical protein
MEDHYARKHGFPTRIGLLILGIAILIIWLLIGIEDKERVNIEENIPIAWLLYKDDTYKGILLDYCWLSICKAYNSNIINFANHIIVQRDNNIGFIITGVDPSYIEPIIYNSIINEDGSAIRLDKLASNLVQVSNDVYKINLPEGSYIIIIHATWNDNQYINYAFSIRVV